MELIVEKGARFAELGLEGIKFYWQWEMDFLLSLQNMHTSWLDVVMKIVTTLGNAGILWIALSIILAAVPKTRKCGFTMIVSIVLTFIIGNLILKNCFARMRPSWVNLDVITSIKPKDYSFPSGHTMNGFTASLVILYYTCKDGIKKAIWGILAVLLAAVIAFSRMYFFVHWPTDIIVGALIGVVDSIISFFVMKKVFAVIEAKKAQKALPEEHKSE